MTERREDGGFDGAALLTRLLSTYRDRALREFATRQDELFQRNAQGLDEAEQNVASLNADDELLRRLNRWMDEAGIDEWEWILMDGGWWSDLHYSCTRFRAFNGDDDTRAFLEWIVEFYTRLPASITDTPVAGDAMKPSIAQGALYIDFEGRVEGPPVLLGILSPGAEGGSDTFRQFVFDPLFADAASAKGAEYVQLDHLVRHLLKQATPAHPIVAWSQHERDVLLEVAGDRMALANRRYQDGKQLAKQWRQRVRPDLQPESIPGKGRHRLSFYLGAIGYEVPSSHGPGLTGRRIKTVRAALEQHAGRYDLLTPVQKRKWANLLEHNRHDCVGMKEFCLRAAADLAAVS